MPSLHPGSWFFLAFLLLGVPAGAFATARRTRSAAGPARFVARQQVYVNAMASQALIFGLAWVAGRLQGLRLLAGVRPTPADYLAGAATLAIMGLMAWVSKVIRTEDERRRMWVLGLLPRTRREGALFTLVAAAASVSEELAYRGVGFALCTILTGSALAGAAISAMAFAAAHFPQGVRSMGIIFVIALVKQELVAVTGTLWIAIGVHFVYDVMTAARMAPRARAADALHVVDAP